MQKHKNNIIRFYQKNRRMPMYSDLLEITGFKSKNAIFRLRNKLVDLGFFSKDDKGHLIPSDSMVSNLAQSI